MERFKGNRNFVTSLKDSDNRWGESSILNKMEKGIENFVLRI